MVYIIQGVKNESVSNNAGSFEVWSTVFSKDLFGHNSNFIAKFMSILQNICYKKADKLHIKHKYTVIYISMYI